MTRPRSPWIVGVVAAISLAGASALAQQPPGDKDPAKLPLGEIQPGGRPAQPQGQPGQPPPGRQFPPPGMGQPGQPGQGRTFQPPNRGGNRPPMPPRPAPEPEHAEHGHAEHHCPGHGPLDSPGHINWWQGIIGRNNEAVKWGEPDKEGHVHREDGFVSQLLWRYENEKDECDPKNQPPPFLASVLNFALLAWVLYRFGKKPLADALSARKKAMMAEIDNATHLKEEAEKRLSDYEDKLENLDETLEEMKKDYAAQGEREREHVLAEAEERRVRMKRDVEFRIEQELKAARQQLLQEAVEQAAVAAESLLKSKVGASDLDRTNDEYLASVGAAWKSGSVASRSAGGAS